MSKIPLEKGSANPASAELVAERSLHVIQVGNATCLDAVTFEDQGTKRARVFFATGTPVDGIRFSSEAGTATVENVGGAPVIDCEVTDGAIGLRLKTASDTESNIPFNPDETDLFAGLDTILAVRNGESVETVVSWLKFHVDHHGLQGVLIFDRARPAESSAFVTQLRATIPNLPGLKQIVVLHADTPLGKRGLPDEAHPLNVIGAPGKDRMEIPDPDPWTAPLGEFLIYEIARTRFLSRARAVANTELFDLIMPLEGTSVFDRATASPTGYVMLSGQQAYPWRVRKDATASFSDHICTQFDTQTVRLRWCVAPTKIQDQTIWRLIRIVGVEPSLNETIPFYRFMALRHPTDSVSKIVPKSSLVENDALLNLSLGYFSAKPVRVPDDETPSPDNTGRSTTIVTTMKNEGPFILEWIAYHRMIGIDNFLVYTNDCTDGTDDLLKTLQDKGIVQHRDNPYRKTKLPPQHAALQAAEKEQVIQKADWLICMDVDEYINIKCGDGRLADLWEAARDANMIALTWRLFGNSDIHHFDDRPIIEQFTRSAPELARKPHQAWGFKTLFQNIGIFKKLGVHRPKGLKPQLWENIRWINGSGAPMPKTMFRNGWRSTSATYGYDLVQLNHYAVRSAESFLVKRDRGRVNHVDRDQGLSYWFRMNNNAEEETSIQRMIPALRVEYDALLADPEIAAAHARCVQLHREKITELKGQDEFLRLYDELTGDRLQKLSRMHSHFGANVFLGGPDVIPDEIVDKDPADAFWFSGPRVTTTTH